MFSRIKCGVRCAVYSLSGKRQVCEGRVLRLSGERQVFECQVSCAECGLPGERQIFDLPGERQIFDLPGERQIFEYDVRGGFLREKS